MGDPRFPERGEVFEEFVRVVDGLALLSDEGVVFFGAHGALDGVSFMASYVVYSLRGLAYGCSNGIVPYKGWEVV